MLTQILCRLRGIDRWPVATASTTSVEDVSTGGRGGITQNIYFTYIPSQSEVQSGKLFIDSYASLYGIKTGDTFDVQYNPRHPSKFYCQESKSIYGDIRLVILMIGIAFAVVVSLIELFGSHGH